MSAVGNQRPVDLVHLSRYTGGDTALNAEILQLFDTQADELRNIIQKELIEDYMMKDPATSPRAVPLLLAARHLERICDHATNIAEDVIFMVLARVARHHGEKSA